MKNEVAFYSINNLFHPATIDGCFVHDGRGACDGYKVVDEDGTFSWNTNPHRDRIIEVTSHVLEVIARAFEDSDDNESTKLVSIHSLQIVRVLEKLSRFSGKVGEVDYFITDCWNETLAVQDGIIQRKTCYPKVDMYELIYSGPHFYVANPFSKTPNESCETNRAYSTIDLCSIETDYAPRTNYIPSEDISMFKAHHIGSVPGTLWIDTFRVCFSKMLSIGGERTLQTALLPPKVSHVGGVMSTQIAREEDMLSFLTIATSLACDFYIKAKGGSNLYQNTIVALPARLNQPYAAVGIARVLMLNALTVDYASIWERNFIPEWKGYTWSREDSRLPRFGQLDVQWTRDTPLRLDYCRRLALVEIDVIVAMALGLSLDELTLIYSVQFPVLQENEADTWYDQSGRIVFTCSKGLPGVGLDRADWEQIKDMKAGETYEHTITKSELYQGKKITYHAPFDKCDRVEDYKVAWAHFEKVFNTKQDA